MMKKTIVLMLSLLVVGCGSKTSGVDEATVRDMVLRNVPGDKDAYKFRVLEMQAQGTVTVADSIAALDAEFEEKKKQDIAHAESLLALAGQVRGADAGLDAKADRQRQVIDSLKAVTVSPEAARYGGRAADEVLVRIVRCRYSVADPKTGREVEEHFDFWLSQDGTKAYEKKKVK